MSENVLIALIASFSALGGGVIGGLISMWSAKKSADREDKRRREEIERKTADERIKNLYEPLLSIITPGPPYDEFYIDREDQKRIIEKNEKNEIYASPELLNVFWEFLRAYYDESGKIDRELDWKIYELVSLEHSRLKDIIGYGRILEKESIIKVIYDKIKSKIEPRYSKIRMKLFAWKARKRRKKR